MSDQSGNYSIGSQCLACLSGIPPTPKGFLPVLGLAWGGGLGGRRDLEAKRKEPGRGCGGFSIQSHRGLWQGREIRESDRNPPSFPGPPERALTPVVKRRERRTLELTPPAGF